MVEPENKNPAESNEETIQTKADQLKTQFSKSEDLVWEVLHTESEKYELIYFDTMADFQYLNQFILPRLNDNKGLPLMEHLVTTFQVKDLKEKEVEDIATFLLQGNILFKISDGLFGLEAVNLPKREPEESALETSIRGPKDGFVEDIKTNISLVRRRLNSSTLCLERYTIGKRSKTKVALLYLDDVINKEVLKEIQSRLHKVETDVLTSTYELESLVRDKPYSVFPSMDFTGRPDFIVQTLNQGRFAIIIDGNPTVTYAPISLLVQTKSPEDNYINYAYVSLERIIRMLGIIISGFLPGMWIAFSSFNIEQIPYLLVATISVSRFGLPLSAAVEMFIILFLFELFNEAGVRLPQAIGQTVAVLGGLIVGDAAIRAGLTSPTMLVVAAITYIASFTLVNQSLSSAVTIIRFAIIILSTIFGLFGVVLGFILTVFYFSTLTSFGEPYLGSLAPVSISEISKSFLKLPLQLYRSRTTSTDTDNPDRGGQA
ncbi:spore germination protein [Sutcliffiella horikoshii]|uniref:spore germination protein n=1 Tax=Sutcliffiella horikoshii TaxID=79883 RepID=UPI002040F30D|nr:spore germination protein [Sutcliffiella horikoshii]MCM3617747.1 spore germination protein [Sutcliffiella horikoshii]